MDKTVRVVLDIDGFLIRAGDPSFTDKIVKKDIMDAIKNGGTVKTITFEEYKTTNWKWIWEK